VLKATIALFLLAVPSAVGQVGKGNSEIELDVGKVLWQSHSVAQKYLGKPTRVLPPRIPAEGWEHQYPGGNGTVGTKVKVLLIVYKYKARPKSWQEALHKVGLQADVPPLDFGTSLIWPSTGVRSNPVTFKGRTLNRVILAKDFSEIEIDGHEPGTY